MISAPRGDDEAPVPPGDNARLGDGIPQGDGEAPVPQGDGEAPAPAPRPGGAHLPSLLLAVLSGLGLVTGLLAAGVLGVLYAGRFVAGMEMGVYAWTAALAAMINLAALLYSAPRAFGRPAIVSLMPEGWKPATIAMGLWLLDLAAASQMVGRSSAVSEVLLPPLTLLAVVIPLWWLIELGRRGLRTTPQRAWGAASTSLMVTAPAVIVVELTTFVFLGLTILIWLAGTSPDLVQQLEQLQKSLSKSAVGPDALIEMLRPYLQRPGVILAGFLVLSVLTPLIEEFFKPLALWFIPGWRIGEAEGFSLGLVAGGIFALLETLGSLAMVNGSPEWWLVLVLVRAGTGLLHITCSGLVGWGLALAWNRARYLQLAGLYLLAVLIHGTWNLFAQMMSLGDLLPDHPLTGLLAHAAPVFLVGLAVASLSLLVGLNRHLTRRQAETAVPAARESEPVPTVPTDGIAGGE